MPRLRGRSRAGPRGGHAGDLYVHLRVAAHPRFTRDGNDLLHRLVLSPSQVALGLRVELETLDGTEQIDIPRGTQPGYVVRLRGLGVPRVRGRGRGDLLVEVVVAVPTELTAEQEELYRSLAAAAGEDVAPPETGLLSKIRSALK